MQEASDSKGQTSRFYQIYALVDPRDNLVHYVGISENAYLRFYGYVRNRTGTATTIQQRKWLAELAQEGISPILQILETIEASDSSYANACERELYWIKELFRLGNPLVNKAGLTRAYVPPNPNRSIPKSIQRVRYPPALDEDFMTSEEVCKRLSVSPRTLERYVRDGLLQKYRRRIGREVFYKRSEVEDLLRIRHAEDIEDQ